MVWARLPLRGPARPGFVRAAAATAATGGVAGLPISGWAARSRRSQGETRRRGRE
ncbi:MAG: hypothetical protein WKF80_10175 [Thermomicrobiales bacterium]